MNATCQKFKVQNYPQLRFAFHNERRSDKIFIFYEMNSLETKLFLFLTDWNKRRKSEDNFHKKNGIQATSNEGNK